ncbi:MAG: TldD/PmbA family protein [Candidatus Nezhaarchaeota archaeon]|nr:TldD/PmbA family protein [Candidatus Nezhaarchaeota archaeon]
MQEHYKSLADSALEMLLDLGVDFADVRLLSIEGLRIEVADGKVKELKFMDEVGLAFRCLVAGGWGFTSTSALVVDEVKRSCLQAYKLAKNIGDGAKDKLKLSCSNTAATSAVILKPIEPLSNMTVAEKLAMCREMEREMLSFSDRVKSTSAIYSEFSENAYTVNSLGLKSEYLVPGLIVQASAYASEAGLVQRGYESHGGTGGLELLKHRKPLDIAEDAARKAIELLAAKSPPAGRHTCILDPELAGVFIHEAFGHACEADLVLSGASILEGMTSKIVGSPKVTVKDDPSLKGLFGHVPADSEGVVGRGTTLVDRGVLMSYMHSLETSSRMGVQPTGNGRAQGYASFPLVRMTNTFIDKGECSVEELFESIRKGVYAKGSSYGYVDPARGEFVFKCSMLYLIEDGEPIQLCRDAALSGHTLEVLMNVEAVADDLSFRPGLCGKEDQFVRVTSGSPHIAVRNVLVGGMA